ncbi:MAG: Minf_1886 family protein [Phycisphaerales bacterium JB039]
MPEQQEMEVNWDAIRREAGPYAHELVAFIRAGLDHTVKMVHGSADAGRHVSGQQLCFGLRDYAIKRYGMLAKTVLNRWGVHRTEDFGRMIFTLIEAGAVRQDENDRFEDFQNVYDFDEAFAQPMDN